MNIIKTSAITGAVLMLLAGSSSSLVLDTFGDADGFGAGVPIQDGLNYLDYGEYWDDNRAGDPAITDYWNAPGTVSWTHTYAFPPCQCCTAELTVFVAGIADMSGWTMSIIFNGTTLFTSPTWLDQHDVTHLLTLNVPTNLLTGSDTVQIVPSAGSMDGWMFDFAELTCEPVPEPGTCMLLASGLLGLIAAAKRR